MSIPVPCPTCGTVLKAPPGSAGRKARCKKCQTKFRIPGDAGAEPSVVEESLMLSAFDFAAPSKPDQAKASQGLAYKSKPTTGGATKLALVVAGLFIALLGTAGGVALWRANADRKADAQIQLDRVNGQRQSEDRKAKQIAESAKRQRANESKPPVEDAPIDPTAEKRPAKSAAPRMVRMAGPKLPPAPAADAKSITSAATIVSLPFEPVQVQSLMVNESATRLAVVRSTFAGFQGQGAIRTVDIRSYPSTTSLSTVEVPSDLPDAVIALGRDDGLLVAETKPGAVTAWKSSDGKKVIDQLAVVPSSGTKALFVDFVPGEESLLAIRTDGSIHRVTVDGAKVTSAFEPKNSLGQGFVAARNRNVVVPADGKLAAFGVGSTVVVASLTSGNSRVEWTSPQKVEQWKAMAVDAGGNRIAGVVLDAAGTLWMQVGRFGAPKAIVNAVLPGECGEVTGIQWYGETVAVRTDANVIILYDCETGGFVGSIRLPASPIKAATIPGGERLIVVAPQEAKSFALIDSEFPFDGYFPLRDRAADDKQPASLRFDERGFAK